MRKIGVRWQIQPWDSTIAAAKMAEQDWIWSVTVPYLGRRPDEHLLRLQEHPDAQPHELERS